MQNKLLIFTSTTAVLLAFLVVMLGAYTRLTDAGLGCPDWPGCYGQMVLPSSPEKIQQAQTQFPQIPIESLKAKTEMTHRYAAGTLGLLIFFIAFYVISQVFRGKHLPWALPLALSLLVIFQALLGMWTVTLKLLPIVVMGHLLGGILIFAGLTRFRLERSFPPQQNLSQWRWGLRLALLIVFLQIALGGWVSANYAGVACVGFPRCNGQWLPTLHFAQGFHLFSPVGANYQGGLLNNEIRISIQWVHRIGALLTACYILSLALLMLRKTPSNYLKTAAWLMAILVIIQFILGVLNVIYFLPIQIAVAHNGTAALLFAVIFTTLGLTQGVSKHAQ